MDLQKDLQLSASLRFGSAMASLTAEPWPYDISSIKQATVDKAVVVEIAEIDTVVELVGEEVVVIVVVVVVVGVVAVGNGKVICTPTTSTTSTTTVSPRLS